MSRPSPALGDSHRRILVLDADLVPALAVARSLHSRGYEVVAASATPRPLTQYSRAVSSTLRYPDPLQSESDFITWLCEWLKNQTCDLVIPVSERTLMPLSRARHRFASCQVAMASGEALEAVTDKCKTFSLAEALGIPTPQSVTVSTPEQLDASLAKLSWPVVIKPSRSVAPHGKGSSKESVRYADTPEELKREALPLLGHAPVILQSFFSGKGTGIELIADHGEILYAFQHERLHEVPLTGGGSSYRRSMPLNPDLLDASRRLIRQLGWHGVAMVEFKRDPEGGHFCLMEINGRFWGSLPLACAADADFPAMLAELYLKGAISPQPDYRDNVLCRNLTRDLQWLEAALRTKPDTVTRVPGAKEVIRDCAQIFHPRHRFDVQSLRDPLPGFIEFSRILQSYWRRVTGRLDEIKFTLQQRRLWRNGTVCARLRAAKSVLFICHGNINRSALAEILMRNNFAEYDLQIRSAGFHPISGRPADSRMVSIAAEQGHDLSGMRSTTLDQAQLEESDIIFLMERRHLLQLETLAPESAERAVLLGAALEKGKLPSGEIPDPYNCSEATYRKCYTLVSESVQHITSLMRGMECEPHNGREGVA